MLKLLYLINYRKFPPLYYVPSQFSKRSASFGYGGRSDFTKTTNTGGLPFYNLKSTIGKKGITFGVGREFYDKVNNKLIIFLL